MGHRKTPISTGDGALMGPTIKDVLELLKGYPTLEENVQKILKATGNIYNQLEDLDRVITTLASQPTQTNLPTPQKKARREAPKGPRRGSGSPEALNMEFLGDYQDLLNGYKDQEGVPCLKPKKWLGPEWTPINNLLRGMGWTWKSLGKKSHWRLE